MARDLTNLTSKYTKALKPTVKELLNGFADDLVQDVDAEKAGLVHEDAYAIAESVVADVVGDLKVSG